MDKQKSVTLVKKMERIKVNYFKDLEWNQLEIFELKLHWRQNVNGHNFKYSTEYYQQIFIFSNFN